MSNEAPYYYGSAENKLNSKGQVAIPARFRVVQSDDEHGRNYVIIRGEGPCLYMYSHRQFGKIKDNARVVAEELGDADFYRSFMAEAHAVDIDTQGRFVLPQSFMKTVGLSGPSVLFIGMDDRIEIWEPSVYDSTRDKTAKYEELRRAASKKIFGI